MDPRKQNIRDELTKYDQILNHDVEEFDSQLNSLRNDLLNYVEQQIRHLNAVKETYEQDFDYLEKENRRTCEDNRRRFDKLCLSINQNDHNWETVQRLFSDFQRTFPMRPTMLKSIPALNFKDIDWSSSIGRQDSTDHQHAAMPPKDDNHSTASNDQRALSDEVERPSLANGRSFTSIDSSNTDEDRSPSGSPTACSLGCSFYKKLISENQESEVVPELRLDSACSAKSECDIMVGLLFKIQYPSNRKVCMLAYHEDENYILIYSSTSRKLEQLFFESRKYFAIDNPFNEYFKTLGYSRDYHSFYMNDRTKLVLFVLEENRIHVNKEIRLVSAGENIIKLMLGKYDMEKSTLLDSHNFPNQCYDDDKSSSYKMVDFAVDISYVSVLARFDDNNKFNVLTFDYSTLERVCAFDLIDSRNPTSIVSATRKSLSTQTTASSSSEAELLLFINDPAAHLVHCCTQRQYLLPIQVNAFGICSLSDGNLALVGNKDVRGLDVRKYLEQLND